MQNDSDWLQEQVRNWATLGLADLLTSLGTPVNKHAEDPELHVLVPHNPRLHRVAVRTREGRVRLISLEGPPFAVPLPVVQAWTREYRRTINTYDAIDDEQFFFYPALPGLPFVAVESWVPPAERRADHQQVVFNELTFYCAVEPGHVPFHFRDGWHFAAGDPSPVPPPPAGRGETGLRRLFRRVRRWLADTPPQPPPTRSVPPLNIFDTLARITDALRAAGGNASAESFADRVAVFGTAGEVLDSSCSLLVGLQQRHPILYAAAREPAEELLAYAQRLGHGPFIATDPAPPLSPPENEDAR
ncbi:hypothetical protein SAMN04515668_4965 [Hymenobacter arizonensis]|uniref:Uncharacterized protein n=2 Tax=Hymenobacter arizonensis TaxID=1227077 RepID=A0A1I6BRE1_HYMAR|nr:hypothetical protein SAMN04515668_4965 [Hymenobacter arizonensis]